MFIVNFNIKQSKSGFGPKRLVTEVAKQTHDNRIGNVECANRSIQRENVKFVHCQQLRFWRIFYEIKFFRAHWHHGIELL